MGNLRTIENKMLPVYETDRGEKVVYGSELHSALMIATPYRMWAERRLDECDAIDGEDYTSEQICTVAGGTPRKEHIIKLDTAKEMAMLERNERGKQVRRYFIEVEKRYRSGMAATFIDGLNAVNALAELLGASRDEKMDMFDRYLVGKGMDTGFMAAIRKKEAGEIVVSEEGGARGTKSSARLLEENGISLTPTALHKSLVNKGLMERRECPAYYNSEKTHPFFALIGEGLEYGINIRNPSYESATLPRFYTDRFKDLCGIVMQAQ